MPPLPYFPCIGKPTQGFPMRENASLENLERRFAMKTAPAVLTRRTAPRIDGNVIFLDEARMHVSAEVNMLGGLWVCRALCTCWLPADASADDAVVGVAMRVIEVFHPDHPDVVLNVEERASPRFASSGPDCTSGELAVFSGFDMGTGNLLFHPLIDEIAGILENKFRRHLMTVKKQKHNVLCACDFDNSKNEVFGQSAAREAGWRFLP